MFHTEYFGDQTIAVWEYLAAVFYIAAFLLIATFIRHKRQRLQPEYRYYVWGMAAKLFGAIGVCMIYVFYYGGGDTTAYYESCLAMSNLFKRSPADYFNVLFSENTLDKMFLFDTTTGYPLRYLYLDDQTFTVIRIASPVLFFAFRSYLLLSILLSWLSYFGTWKLYQLFVKYYPPLRKQLAIVILFVPSVIFWGSGLLKDTITYSSACWFVYSIYRVFIDQKRSYWYVIVMLLSAFVIIKIKPYIFITLLPGTLLWVLNTRFARIKRTAVRFVLIPFLIVASATAGMFILSRLGESMSKFSLDKVLQTASITQKDLKSEAYSQNAFDIGEFDPTVSGIAGKVPVAVTAGLFRPFIWESRNPVMFLSGVENLLILGLTIFLLLRIKPLRLLKIIYLNPLLFFSLLYSLFFAFAVGLTSANFGALVRFKIPFVPFYLSSLVILLYFMRNRELLTVGKEVRKGKTVRDLSAPLIGGKL